MADLGRSARSRMVGKHVRVVHDDGTQTFGVVEAVTRRGHKVRTDDGRMIYAAWWRLLSVGADPDRTGSED